MTKKPAFSLLEVMVILLILAVTLAATAPMISKKMSRNVGTAEEPWRFNGMNQTISFNGNKSESTTLFIGANRRGRRVFYNAVDKKDLLYIRAFGHDSGVMPAANNNVAAQSADVQAISFARPFDINGEVRTRIMGHLGMVPINNHAYPFIGFAIPRREGLIIGPRVRMSYSYAREANLGNQTNTQLTRLGYDATGDNAENKLIVACDSDFSEHSSSADHSGAAHNIAVRNRNLVVLGNMIGIKGIQDFVAVGVSIATGHGAYANPVSRTTVINTQCPQDTVPIRDNNTTAGHFYNMFWSRNPTGFDPIVRADHEVILDDMNNDVHNNINENDAEYDMIAFGVTSLGGRNQSVGSRNTMLGHNLHCGRVLINFNDNSGARNHRADEVSNSVAIGSTLFHDENNAPVEVDGTSYGGAYGNNSVSIGANSVAGTQANRMGDLASFPVIRRDATNGQTSSYNRYDARDNTVAIGYNAIAPSANTVAIGSGVRTVDGVKAGQRAADTSRGAVVIGSGSRVLSQECIAIGNNAYVPQGNDFAIALGNRTESNAHSVAIGERVEAGDNKIVLGSDDLPNNQVHTVVIPGTLDVRGSIQLSGAARAMIENDMALMQALQNYNPLVPSDIRLKNVGEKFTSGLEDIKKLEFFNYTYKNDKKQKPHVGVMAQDLQKVFPISVTEGSDGYLTIRLDEMFYAALNAIKELDRKIIALAVEVKEFFSRVDKLDLRVAKHQAALDELKSDSAQIDARLARLEEE